MAAALGVRPSPSDDAVARKPPSGTPAQRPQSAHEAQAKQQEQVGIMVFLVYS